MNKLFTVRSVIILAFLLNVAVLVLGGNISTVHSSPAKVAIDPPSSGDWNVDDVTTKTGETILLNGSIYVYGGGSLTLIDCTIIFKAMTTHGEFNITVTDGSTLIIQNSNVTTQYANNQTYVRAVKGSHFTLEDSVLTRMGPGYAVSIQDSDTVASIARSEIYADSGHSLSLYNTTGVQVTDSRLISTFGRVHLSLSRDLVFTGNYFKNGESWYTVNIIDVNNSVFTDNTFNQTNDNLEIVFTGLGIARNIRFSNNQFIINSSTTLPHITATESHDLSFVDNYFSPGYSAIYLNNGTNAKISGNTISEVTNIGIEVTEMPGLEITENSISNTAKTGIYVEASNLANISHNILTNINTSDPTARGIHMINSNDTTIHDNTISKTGDEGIYVDSSFGGIISNNDVEFSVSSGIMVYYSSDVHVDQNIVRKVSYQGIYVYASHHLEVSENLVSDANNGIYLSSTSHNNTMVKNIVSNSNDGIEILGDENEIVNNSILFNNVGIRMSSLSEQNVLFYNDLIECILPARDEGTGNKWSDKIGSVYFGNYWGTAYTGNDTVEPFGIGDTPYNIIGIANSADLYPLMAPGTIPDPTINSPADLFIVTNTTGNQIVWLATTLIPATYVITFNGTVLPSNVWDGSAIIYSVDGLTPGVYTVECTVYDIVGRTISDSLTVTVLAESPTAGSGAPPLDITTLLLGLVGGIGLVGVLYILLRFIRR